MRIGLVIYGDLSYTSGGFLYDRKVVERLEAGGDEAVIISLPWRRYGQHLLDNFSPRLYRELVDRNLDLLVEDELNHPSLFLMNRWLKRRTKVPIVAIVHHLRWRERHPSVMKAFYRSVEHWYLRGLDGWVSVSKTTQQDVISLGGREGPSRVCRPGGNRWQNLPGTEEIRIRAESGGPLRLVFLGNAIPRKGLHTLIEAVMSLPEGCCTLNVIGHLDTLPDYVAGIHARLEENSWRDRVGFAGAISGEQVGEALRAADVLVVPSAYEGYGIVYLEGMAFGLPAIGGKDGAAREIIREGENGYLVDYGDAVTLASRIRNLSEDRALLGKMSAAARRHYDAQSTWENTTDCVRNFLYEISANAIIR
ncbi:MAG: glycosyltransferase family 1 protein [Anaerolineae bacterium]|nr:MAG: glycosyltransferase family 1 protein [Anaerolineae bacterium]